MNTPRHKHDAILLPDGKVLVIGGASRRDSLYKSTEIYDPSTRTSTPTTNLNAPRFKFRSSTIALSGKILLVGGSNKAEIYDIESGRFHPLQEDLKATRYFSTSTLLNNGDVLVAGGYDDNVAATKKVVVVKRKE